MLKLFEKDEIFKNSIKPRPVEEILNIQIFRPLAHLILLKIKDTKINPETIVLIHTVLVIISSFIIYLSESFYLDFICFLLLQLKTVLDNLDGQLARYKNLTSLKGRYLDTLMDFIGNFFLFLAIGLKYNNLIFSMLSFFCLTIVLSYDFNFEKLYRKAIGQLENNQLQNRELESQEKGILFLLEKLYEFLLGYQDKAIIFIENLIFERLNSKNNKENLETVFWNKNYLHFTVNMGLSTQLFILGILVLFDLEKLYLFVPFICFAIILLLLIFRITRCFFQ